MQEDSCIASQAHSSSNWKKRCVRYNANPAGPDTLIVDLVEPIVGSDVPGSAWFSLGRPSIDAEGVAIARSAADAPEIDGLVYIEDGAHLPVGEFATVQVIDADEHDLYAESAAPPRRQRRPGRSPARRRMNPNPWGIPDGRFCTLRTTAARRQPHGQQGRCP